MSLDGAAAAWQSARLAAALFAVDPAGLGGVVVRCGPGPVRDRWLAHTRGLLPPGAPVRRIPLRVEDDRLLGGLDLPSSLAAGRPIALKGLLAESDGGVAILAMAERVESGVAARLGAALDHGQIIVERDGLALRLPARIGVIALDEGATPEERPPSALLERLAFLLDLNEVPVSAALEEIDDAAAVARARERLHAVAPADPRVIEAICEAAQMLGLGSLRAPLLTLRAARAHAAYFGRSEITGEDAAAASRLVLGPRALTAPAPAEPEAAAAPQNQAQDREQPQDIPPESSEPPSDRADDEPAQTPSMTEMVVQAIQAALPDELLANTDVEGRASRNAARARGSGASAKSALRGRPIGSRPGALRAGARLNLLDTLRTAAPWQRLRANGAEPGRILVLPCDFRVRRFVQRMQSTTIFAVDASGSAAFQRLSEAKGAVELLLAKAYVSRAQVALIAFRGEGAEILLPPTRSLTRAKSRLADLPGGGGTPLAAGVEAALGLALTEQAKDHTPLLVFLTDGRANIGRDGSPGRAVADADAMTAARKVGEAGVAAVFVDTSARPAPNGDRFARAMGAAYAPLPYVDANAMFGLVKELAAVAR
jgi:magnesium chelatase subunit D